MHIVTLATCHNRKEKTLNSLADLHSQDLPASATIEHVIVDDGSTDGTGEAIAEQYPDVEVVQGTGNLYWAGGMRYGWENSVKNKQFDFLFVYNDDVSLKKNALNKLLEVNRNYEAKGGSQSNVTVGAFLDRKGEKMTYGGVVRRSGCNLLKFKQVEPPQHGYRLVDTLNMNGCLITKNTIENIGFLAPYFLHRGADFEYGVKLKKNGGSVLYASGYIGFCDRNEKEDNYIARSSSFIESYRYLISPKKGSPGERMIYYKEHGGKLWFIFWIKPYVSHFYTYNKVHILKLVKSIFGSGK